MIRFDRIAAHQLESAPYRWAAIDQLFSVADAAALATTFPRDHFKRLADYAGEKDFEYEARALIGMGSSDVSRPHELSEAWRQLAQDFLSADYRKAMSALIGIDLTSAPLEVNVFHYPPGGSLGAHPDLRDKIVTHVLYFNEAWNEADGGCLNILRSKDESEVAGVITPVVGNSAVLVRSDDSWHAVSPVVKHCRLSRRSLTATFYHPGSLSTMWPPDDQTPLHRYEDEPASRLGRWWKKIAG